MQFLHIEYAHKINWYPAYVNNSLRGGRGNSTDRLPKQMSYGMQNRSHEKIVPAAAGFDSAMIEILQRLR